MRLRTRVGPCCALLVFITGIGACAEPTAPSPGSAELNSTSRASPRVVEAVRSATTRAPSTTETVSVPGGGQVKHVSLGEGYQHVAVGRLEADGTVSTACVDSAPQAEAFLSGEGGSGTVQ